jgi:hypothetical protein
LIRFVSGGFMRGIAMDFVPDAEHNGLCAGFKSKMRRLRFFLLIFIRKSPFFLDRKMTFGYPIGLMDIIFIRRLNANH